MTMFVLATRAVLVEVATKMNAVEAKDSSETVKFCFETVSSSKVWLANPLIAGCVVIPKVQPPDIDPLSPAVSSTTNRLHSPLGELPLKSLRELPYAVPGAGAG